MRRTRLSVFCDRVLEAGWLAAAIVVPLFFNAYSRRVFEPDKLSLLRSIASLMVLAWLVKVIEEGLPKEGKRRSSFLHIPLVIPTLLLGVIYILSTLASINPHISFWGSYQRMQGTYTTLSYMVIFLLALGSLRTREQAERLVTTIILTSLPISFYGILQHYGKDPLAWQGDVITRPTSTMGNPIFLAAYVIMAVPLTLGRLVESLSALRTEERKPLNIVLASCYTFLLALEGTCIFFTQSRGPWLGLMGGIFLFALLFATIRGMRKLSLGVIGIVALLALFLLVLNLPHTPLASFKELPYVGRLGRIFETERGTGRVRLLIWEGAVQLVSSNPVRAIIGYGPESMYAAYSPFYPPELAHYEARNASPDRSHNETFDALVITGGVGLVIYLFLFASIFYYGLKWLGLIATPWERQIFASVWIGSGALGAILPRILLGSFTFSGVGIPAGITVGLVIYLVAQAVARSNKGERGGAHQELLVVALLSAIMAHFIEIHFGIAIAATRTYFWLYAALLVVLGHVLPQEEALAATPPARSRRPSRRRHRKKGTEREHRGAPLAAEKRWLYPILSLSLIAGLILLTMVYDLATREFNPRGKYASIMGLFLITWLTCGLVIWLRAARRRLFQTDGESAFHATLSYALISWAWLWGFAGFHLRILRSGGDAGKTMALYYLALFLTVALTAAVLPRPATPPVPWLRRRWNLPKRVWAAFYLVAIPAAVILIITVNLDVITADMYYNRGLSYFNARRWDQAIQLYERALEKAPGEDFYYFELARAYQHKSREASDISQREALLKEAITSTERAHRLNPLSTDHVANLGRLHLDLADMTDDQTLHRETIEQSLEYYHQATEMSPHAAHIFNELAAAYLVKGDFSKALENFQHSLSLDDKYDQTYIVLGNAYLGRGELGEAEAAFRKAIELTPDSLAAHRGLSLVYSRQGNLEEAIEETSKVAELSPRDHEAHKNLSLLYKEAGRLEEAIMEAEKALVLAPAQEKPEVEKYLAQLEAAKK